jgi:hypothetical protein
MEESFHSFDHGSGVHHVANDDRLVCEGVVAETNERPISPPVLSDLTHLDRPRADVHAR